jgi:hypothetical protein
MWKVSQRNLAGAVQHQTHKMQAKAMPNAKTINKGN